MKFATLPLAALAVLLSACSSSTGKIQSNPTFNLSTDSNGGSNITTVDENTAGAVPFWVFHDDLIAKPTVLSFTHSGEANFEAGTTGFTLSPGESEQVAPGVFRYGPLSALIILNDDAPGDDTTAKITLIDVSRGQIGDARSCTYIVTDSDVKPSN